jgi:predicted MFS family arabinose efflux permease
LAGWGTLYIPFTLMLQPMEAELGWSRPAISGAFTLGLLVSGLFAIPVGRLVDRRGGRGVLGWGALAGAALLALWSLVTQPWQFYAIWLAMGVVHAVALWTPAMAVVVAIATQPLRAITAITFITGFTATIFLPLTDALILHFGWRGALLALAGIQLAGAAVAFAMLPSSPPPAPKSAAGRSPLREALRRPAFWGIALLLAAHSFVGVALGAHIVPLLRETGIAEASVIWLAALHGPFQVAARAGLFLAGNRVSLAAVGLFSSALLPLSMIWLALVPAEFVWLLGFALAWAVADGLLSIVRAGAPAEFLGREGYGAVTGALAMLATPMRAFAPFIVALIWQASGGYGPAIWLLAAMGVLAFLGFLLAVLDRRA